MKVSISGFYWLEIPYLLGRQLVHVAYSIWHNLTTRLEERQTSGLLDAFSIRFVPRKYQYFLHWFDNLDFGGDVRLFLSLVLKISGLAQQFVSFSHAQMAFGVLPFGRLNLIQKLQAIMNPKQVIHFPNHKDEVSYTFSDETVFVISHQAASCRCNQEMSRKKPSQAPIHSWPPLSPFPQPWRSPFGLSRFLLPVFTFATSIAKQISRFKHGQVPIPWLFRIPHQGFQRSKWRQCLSSLALSRAQRRKLPPSFRPSVVPLQTSIKFFKLSIHSK